MHLHFRPTSASWLNLVECWFALLITRRLARGAFHSTRALEQAIKRYIAATNADPKPFVWTRDRRSDPGVRRPLLPTDH